MDIEGLHKLIDEWAVKQPKVTMTVKPGGVEGSTLNKELPKDKRVVRTKTSGDRVYLLDEVKKTRQWVTSPEILQKIGFDMSDVIDVDDSELAKYQMGAALYRIDE